MLTKFSYVFLRNFTTQWQYNFTQLLQNYCSEVFFQSSMVQCNSECKSSNSFHMCFSSFWNVDDLDRWCFVNVRIFTVFRVCFQPVILINVFFKIQGKSTFVCGKCDKEWRYTEVRKMALLNSEEMEYFEKTMATNTSKNEFHSKSVSTGLSY